MKLSILVAPEHKVYGLTEDEIDRVAGFGDSVWREAFFGSLGVGIPCVLNAILAAQSQGGKENPSAGGAAPWDYEVMINGGVFIACCVFCLVFGCLWYRASNGRIIYIQGLKGKKTKVEEIGYQMVRLEGESGRDGDRGDS